jgi:hypothetical protein
VFARLFGGSPLHVFVRLTIAILLSAFGLVGKSPYGVS